MHPYTHPYTYRPEQNVKAPILMLISAVKRIVSTMSSQYRDVINGEVGSARGESTHNKIVEMQISTITI